MKHLKRIIYLAIVLLAFLYGNAVYATTGKVITDTLKLRKSPTTESNVLELISMDDEIEILGKEGDWYKTIYNGTTGYVSSEYVKVKDDNTNKNINKTENDNNRNIEGIGQNEQVNQIQDQNQQVNKSENINQNQEKNETTSNDANSTISILEDEENKIGEKQWKGKISSDAKVYATPLINSIQTKEIKKGDNIQIISKTSNWCYVVSQDIIGWIRTNKIEVEEAEKTEELLTQEVENVDEEASVENEDTTKTTLDKTAYIKETVVNIRNKPDATSEKVMVVVQNTEVQVIAEDGEWYEIKIGEKEGYVLKTLISDQKVEVTTRQLEEEREKGNSNQDKKNNTVNQEKQIAINPINASTSGNKIVEYARKFLGCKYVYGASGPTTFDCSGFTQYVYKQNGYSISRSARTQANEGTKVSKENLVAGDLVVFYENDLSAIGHIGIYIGNGKFIHASSYTNLKCLETGKTGNMVKISDLTKGEYAKRFHSAVRIIK